MKELYTEVEIDAPAEKVWEVLTDFARFSEWNPFIRNIEGKAESGSRVRIQVHPPGGRAVTFRPKILRVQPGEELRWKGSLVVPGLLDGKHTFKIEELAPGRVRFVQRETFTGVLVRFFERSLDRKTKQGFREMNQALKIRSEQGVQQPVT